MTEQLELSLPASTPAPVAAAKLSHHAQTLILILARKTTLALASKTGEYLFVRPIVTRDGPQMAQARVTITENDLTINLFEGLVANTAGTTYRGNRLHKAWQNSTSVTISFDKTTRTVARQKVRDGKMLYAKPRGSKAKLGVAVKASDVYERLNKLALQPLVNRKPQGAK